MVKIKVALFILKHDVWRLKMSEAKNLWKFSYRKKWPGRLSYKVDAQLKVDNKTYMHTFPLQAVGLLLKVITLTGAWKSCVLQK